MSRKCPVASTYKINIQTHFWHLQSTCWSFWHRLIRPNTMTTGGSAANSTATMPVPYRQRLNSPNVKSTSGWTAICSQFVGRGAMLSYNSPSLNFSTTLDQRRQKFLDGRRQPRLIYTGFLENAGQGACVIFCRRNSKPANPRRSGLTVARSREC